MKIFSDKSMETRRVASWMKGAPDCEGIPEGSEISSIKANLFREEISLPCAILKEKVLRNNERWMNEFCKQARVEICPHGKTTMSPELFTRQLRSGAWGITAATPHQLKTMRMFGIDRILYAISSSGPR